MRTLARRVAQLERSSSVRAPIVFVRLLEPMGDAPQSEWDDFHSRMAKAEAEGKSVIVRSFVTPGEVGDENN